MHVAVPCAFEQMHRCVCARGHERARACAYSFALAGSLKGQGERERERERESARESARKRGGCERARTRITEGGCVDCFVKQEWELWDATRPLEGDCDLKLHKFDEPQGKEARARPLLIETAWELPSSSVVRVPSIVNALFRLRLVRDVACSFVSVLSK
eukprot:6196687-Pleurochrysis_carterae.AAC.2